MFFPFRKSRRALLLDDDGAMRRLVTLQLKRAGFRVDEVLTGMQAIEAIGRETYDAVLLDLMMPHEGGMTVIRHLREKNPQMLRRVVVISAAPEHVLRAFEEEVFAIVRKPFKSEELAAIVDGLRA
jgi:DNA-binding response OmpR family regulator